MLECENEDGSLFYYVGFEHRSQIGNRVGQHFAGRGAAYTQARRPKRVLLVWPVRHAAAEAYLFALLLSTLPAGSLSVWVAGPRPQCGRHRSAASHSRSSVGVCAACVLDVGASTLRWTATNQCRECSTSALVAIVLFSSAAVVNRCWRMRREPRRPRHCGTTRSLPAGASTLSQPPLAQIRPATAPPPPRVGAQPRCDPPCLQRVERPAKVAKTSAHAGKRVSICGREYTALSWYLGVPNPSKPDCRKVGECVAVELDGGDLRTSVAEGYAVAPPQRPKPLLPGRERLATSWIDTGICTDKKVIVHVRRQGEVRVKSLRQSLFLVSDLESKLKP